MTLKRFLTARPVFAAAVEHGAGDDISNPAHPLHRAAKAKPVTPQVAAIPGTAPLGIVPTSKAKRARKAPTPAPTPAVEAATSETPAPVKAKRPRKAAAVVEPGTEGTPKKNPRSIVPVRFKQAYAKTNDTCGSKLALALKAATTVENSDGRETLDVDALWAIAAANNVDVSKYVGLNNGQKRMNVGNKLAGKLKQGEKVVVGKQVFANAAKALAKKGVEEAEAEA